MARGGWEGRERGKLRGLWERVDQRTAGHRTGEDGREGAGVQDGCDIVRLARVAEARRRFGPHQVIRVGCGDEEHCDGFIGCGGRGGQEQEGGRDGAAGEVEEVGFLPK